MAKVIIFSGAGISAESGISTFRDSNGLWENHKIQDVCTAGCLETNRQATLNFYDYRRLELATKEPNKAHYEIAKLKEKYPDKISVITQNVDNLFEKAGVKDVLHLHGFLTSIRCESCSYYEEIGYKKLQEVQEHCPICSELMRPDIVFFYEAAPKYEMLIYELQDCECLVVIGTSGEVIDISALLTRFLYNKNHKKISLKILNNLYKSDSINSDKFDKVYYEKATTAIDKIVKDVESFLHHD